MVSTIGIKIANGEFYSILEENSPVKKRLVLTTVHDNQRSVQIDLYKSHSGNMADAQYIGSLVMENIKPRPKGEPSIELIISSAANGEIIADAVDLDTSVQGEHHVLNVSLKSLDEDNREYELPDFELEQSEAPPTGLLGKAKETKSDQKGSKFPWVILIIGIIIIIGLIVFFMLRDNSDSSSTGETKPAAQEQTKPAAQPAVQTQQPAAQTAPPPVIQAPARAPAAAPAKRDRPPAPVSSYRVPSVIPKEGAPYTIRWGDTLWDIAEAFYRNPWLYPRIARFNNIRNPDLIISGTTIRVPPRN